MRTGRNAKKLCAFILAFVMVFTNAQMSVFADAADDPNAQTQKTVQAREASRDVGDYLKGVEFYKDLDGAEQYDPNSDLPRDEKIAIRLKFAEDSSLGGIQFPDDGVMKYTIPDVFQINSPVTGREIYGDVDGKPDQLLGTMDIDLNGEITFKLKPDIVSKYKNVTVYAMFDASFKSDVIGNKKTQDIVFSEGVKKTVNLDPVEDVTVEKSCEKKYGSATEFTYTIKASSTKGATDVTITDTPGENLIIQGGSFKVNGIPVPIRIENNKYIINLNEIKANEEVTITYDAQYDPAKLSSLNGTLYNIGNNVTAESDLSKPSSDSVNPTYEYKILSKSNAQIDQENKTATWTVTVNEKTSGKDISGWTVKDSLDNAADAEKFTLDQSQPLKVEIKDSTGAIVKTENINWSDSRLNNVTDKGWEYVIPSDENKNYTYVFSYQTKMESDAMKGPKVKNTAKLLDTDNNERYSVTTEGDMQGKGLPPNAINKQFVDVVSDGDAQYLKWQATVTVPANTEYTNVSFSDNTHNKNGHEHLPSYTIVNSNEPAYNEIGITVSDNKVNNAINPMEWYVQRNEWGTLDIKKCKDGNESITLPSNDSEYTITFTYYTKQTTKFDDQNNKITKNTMTMNVNGSTASSTAEYENHTSGLKMSKAVESTDNANGKIKWNLLLNEDKSCDIPDTFTITDIVDEGKKSVGHTLDADRVEIKFGPDSYNVLSTLPTQYYKVVPSDDNKSFEIRFTGLGEYAWPSPWNENSRIDKPVLQINYTTTVKEEKFLEQGDLTFNNKAVLEENDKIVTTSKAETTIKDNKVFGKAQIGTPDGNNGYTATFKMDINPHGIFLNPDSTETNRKTYTISDQMSETLQLNFYTIKVRNESLNKDLSLKAGDYKLWYNKSDRRLTITIPNADGYHYTVTYDTTVIGKIGQNVEYKNSASLDVGSTQVDDYDQIVVEHCSMQQYDSVVGGAASADLYMTKFDSTRFQNKLEAQFELYQVTDEDWESQTPMKKFTSTPEKENDNLVYLGTIGKKGEGITELYTNVLYALKETKPQDGYQEVAEPYYFVIPNTSDMTKIDKLAAQLGIEYDVLLIYAKEANKYIVNRNIQIDNSPTAEKVGSLKITKTFKGDTGKLTDVQKDAIEFVVTNADGYSNSITYAEMKNAGGSWTIDNLSPGTYTVTEKMPEMGVEYNVITEYSIEGGKVEIEANKETTLEVTNTYEDKTSDKGTLKITKQFTGSQELTESDKANIEFKVTNAKTGYEATKKFGEFENGKWLLTGLDPGPYLVQEINANNDGYDLETTYEVKGVTGTVTTDPNEENKGATASVVKGGTVEVKVTNNYTKQPVAPDPIDVTLDVQKQIKVSENSDAVPAGKAFTFDLYKATDAGQITGDKLESITVDSTKAAEAGKTTAVGSKTFATLTGLTAGEYKYIIKESADGKADGWTYDSTEHLVTVKVDEKDGTLAASISGDDVNGNTLTVTNEYTKPAERSITITKKDVVGDEELEGATLKITDEKGKTVKVYIDDADTKSDAEWTSGKEAVNIGGLEVGKVYKLVEETAPEGFEKLKSEVTFEVNKDGTVKVTASKNSVTVDGKTTEYTEAEATNDNKGIIVNDAPVVEKPTEPSKPSDESKPSTEPSSSTDPTDPSDKPDDPSKESSSSTEQSKPSSEPSSKPSDKPSSETTEQSKPTDSTEPEGGSLTVIKEIEVTFDFDEGPKTYNDLAATFEIGLFTDKAGKKPYGDPIELNTVAGPAKATFEGLPAGTYYVYELDCDGNAITGNHGLAGDLGFIGYESEITVSQNKVTVKENQKVKDPVTVTNKCYIDLTSAFSYDLISISGTKTWNDNNDAAGKRPKDLKLTLNNGEKEITPQNTDPNGEYYIEWDNAAGPDQWTYTISNVPQVDVTDPNWQGEDLLEYTIKEEPVDGYEAAHNGIAKGTKDTANNNNNIINADFENTYTGKTKGVTDTGSTTTPGNTTGTDTTPDATKTNDTMNFMPYLMLLIASAAVGGTTIFARRRKDSK